MEKRGGGRSYTGMLYEWWCHFPDWSVGGALICVYLLFLNTLLTLEQVRCAAYLIRSNPPPQPWKPRVNPEVTSPTTNLASSYRSLVIHTPGHGRHDSNSIQVSNYLPAIVLISHHLSHYVLYQQRIFINLNKVSTCHSIPVSIRVLQVAYPGF